MAEDSDSKVIQLETEITRYKMTLAKMEKQWREATAAIKDNRMQEKINALNQEV